MFGPNGLCPTIFGCQATNSIPPQVSRKESLRPCILTPSRPVGCLTPCFSNRNTIRNHHCDLDTVCNFDRSDLLFPHYIDILYKTCVITNLLALLETTSLVINIQILCCRPQFHTSGYTVSNSAGTIR